MGTWFVGFLGGRKGKRKGRKNGRHLLQRNGIGPGPTRQWSCDPESKSELQTSRPTLKSFQNFILLTHILDTVTHLFCRTFDGKTLQSQTVSVASDELKAFCSFASTIPLDRISGRQASNDIWAVVRVEWCYRNGLKKHSCLAVAFRFLFSPSL